MEKYIISIEEMVVHEFEIFAENEESAVEIAEKRYRNKEFMATQGKLSAKQMAILSPGNLVSEWIEF